MSPEVLKGDNQSYEVDTWALGILLYELFHLQTPFKGRTPHEMLNCILEKKPKISNLIPKDAKDLIQRLLVIEPSRRITLEEIQNHPFILRFPCVLQDSAQEETTISEKKESVQGTEDNVAKKSGENDKGRDPPPPKSPTSIPEISDNKKKGSDSRTKPTSNSKDEADPAQTNKK